jgi:hypothetical protein
LGKTIFRAAVTVSALALAIATAQILFDVPLAPFLVPEGARGAGAAELTARYEGGVQRVTAKLNIIAYPSIIVQRGIPVEFTLSAAPSGIDECNEWILLPDYGIERRLAAGDNLLRFTPEESGVFQIVCGLGRMKSSVTVVESLGFLADAAPAPEPSASPLPADTTLPETPPETPKEAAVYRRKVTLPSRTAQPDGDAAPVFEKPEDAGPGLGGWLEKQLTPQSGREGAHEIRAWTGWIFDRDCVGITPVRHTKACNLMGSCYDSGLGIFEYVPGKAFDTYTALETFLCFDGASKELAAAFLTALPAAWKNNVTVTVKGYAVNNIPASAEELLIPETNLSLVDHYLHGIHVTSIEAAFIDGVSTHALPDPNIALTQP